MWNNKRYWMALTPYPSAAESLENPSLMASDDGSTWTTPAGLTNPIIPAVDADTFNSDGDILIDGATMWLTYRTYNRVTHAEKVYVLSSTDGVTWSAATEILSGTAQTAMMSPSVVKIGSTFYMYTVDGTGHYNKDLIYRVNRRSCSTMDGTWSAPVLVSFPIYLWMTAPTIRPTNPWHIDVVYEGGEYFALVLTWDYYFLIGKSTDGVNFVTSTNAVMSPAAGVWDAKPYRGSVVRTPTGFDLWYSAYDNGTPQVWRIGKTAIAVPFVS